MTSPFRIDGPAVVSFSGGRTSGYMLRRILDEGLQENVHVLFANTGKEREETLDFVQECAQRWAVRIRWLEYRPEGFVEVTHATASRKGEPFEALVASRKYLPNPVTRFCTSDLKIKCLRAFILQQGHKEWTSAIGIRADEPSRVAKLRARTDKQEDIALPLVEAGVTEADVLRFWRDQPFDLKLRRWEGNCDLCFLKGVAKRQRIMEDRPDLATWWVDMEKRIGAGFRFDVPPYAALLAGAQGQGRLFANTTGDDLADCICNEGTGA